MKPTSLALATIATSFLGLPLAAAQVDPGETPTGDTTASEPAVPEEPPPPPPPAEHGAAIKYDGGFALASDDGQFEMKLGLRSQFRFDLLRKDADPTEFNGKFAVNRLRLNIDGHAYGAANTYKLEFDMANRGFAILKDMFVDHAFSPTLHIRAGQWKKPFNRQEMVSDFSSEMVERSLLNDFVGAGRDQGVALHNDYEKSPDGIEWALGVFNNGSEKPTQSVTCVPGMLPTDPPVCGTKLPSNEPADWGPALVAHVGWNGGKIKGYSEGDLEGGPLRYAIAASYRLVPNDFDDGALQHTVVIDAMIKASGLELEGAFALRKLGDADPQNGFYVQGSYMLMPKKLLGAVRFAQVPLDSNPDEHKREILGGFDWLWKGHKLKVMADAGIIQTTGADTNDLQIRTQLQLVL